MNKWWFSIVMLVYQRVDSKNFWIPPMVNWRKTGGTQAFPATSLVSNCCILGRSWMCSECLGLDAPTSWWKMRITNQRRSLWFPLTAGWRAWIPGGIWTRKDWTTDGQWSLPISAMTLSDGSIGFHHRVCFACCCLFRLLHDVRLQEHQGNEAMKRVIPKPAMSIRCHPQIGQLIATVLGFVRNSDSTQTGQYTFT